MKKQSITYPITHPIPEFGTEPAHTFYGRVIAPSHSPCWCIKPSDISVDATMFDNLKQSEAEYHKQGKQLWLISFEEKNCEITLAPFSFLLTDSTLERPTTEQLSRLENWFSSINYALSTVKDECMEDY